MKLGSLKEGGRDGTLVVVSRDLCQRSAPPASLATLQRALEDWENAAPPLNALSDALNDGSADGVFDLDMHALAAPLPPRAYSSSTAAPPAARGAGAPGARGARCRTASTPTR